MELEKLSALQLGHKVNQREDCNKCYQTSYCIEDMINQMSVIHFELVKLW